MDHYKNLSGDSPVLGYEAGEDYLIVEFKHGGKYLYDNPHTGVKNIEEMKILAKRGSGLASFITREIKKNYACKL